MAPAARPQQGLSAESGQGTGESDITAAARHARRQTRWWAAIAAGLLVLAAGGFTGWWLWENRENVVTASQGNQASFERDLGESDQPSSAPTTAVSTQPATPVISSASEAECSSMASQLVAQVHAWAANLSATQATSAPSIEALEGSDCDENVITAEAIDMIESELASARGWTRVGLLSFLHDPSDPDGTLASAVDAYPDRPDFQLSSRPNAIPTWIIVLESIETNQNTQAFAESRISDYVASFPTSTVILSDEYVSLRPGYWAIVAAGFQSFDAALDACQDAGLGANECYPRLLQDLENQSEAMDGCGYFGRYVSSSATSVYLHPRVSVAEVRGLLGARNEIYSAGPSYRTNGEDWLPVVGGFAEGNRMGWVDATAMSLDPDCMDHPQIPVPDSCRSIVDDAILTLTRMNPTELEVEILVARADLAACEVRAVNQGVSAGLTQTVSDDPYTEFRNEVWSLIPLLPTSGQ